MAEHIGHEDLGTVDVAQNEIQGDVHCVICGNIVEWSDEADDDDIILGYCCHKIYQATPPPQSTYTLSVHNDSQEVLMALYENNAGQLTIVWGETAFSNILNGTFRKDVRTLAKGNSKLGQDLDNVLSDLQHTETRLIAIYDEQTCHSEGVTVMAEPSARGKRYLGPDWIEGREIPYTVEPE